MSKHLTWLGLFVVGLVSFGMHYPHFTKDLMSTHVWRQAQTQSTINNFYDEKED